jgi:hypothetical protein
MYLKQFNQDQIDEVKRNSDKGYVTCAGKKHLADLIRTIYALRITWNSNYPVAIMHCNELDESFMETIRAMDVFQNIQFVDVCQDATYETVGAEGPAAVKRFRGYFCKAAALVRSPYEHSMMLDLDLVWFKNPDKLFHSPFYTKTGALFFRDRWISHTPSFNTTTLEPDGVIKTLLKNFELFNIQLNSSWVQQQYYANGINPFWKAVAKYWPKGASSEMNPSFYQDSSIVVLQKSRHQGMIAALKKLMLPFEAFNGDQDIYWVAATAAGEPFTFSPYGGAQYGDCYGFMLHYDPDDALSETPEWPTPFYINSEYLVEEHERLTSVGQYYKPTMMRAPVIAANKTFPNLVINWERGHLHEKCSSKIYPFVDAHDYMHRQVLYHQWLVLSVRIKRDDFNLSNALDGKQCLPIMTSSIGRLNELIQDKNIFRPEDCIFMGCPKMPIQLTEKNPEKWKPGIGRICDPIVFRRPHISSIEPPVHVLLDHFSDVYRRPIPGINTPVFEKHQAVHCSFLGWDEHFYLLKNDNQFHEFPDDDTIKSMGFDKAKIRKLPVQECEMLSFGSPLPKLKISSFLSPK